MAGTKGDFALITEGRTDQKVIRNILLGSFKDWEEEPIINAEQPQLDATGEQGEYTFGGWAMVIKYFQMGKFRQALQLNRELVVHIDTDVSDSYGVAKQEAGRELSPEELVLRVIARFREMIGEDIYREHGDRFLFAVAVHTIECWLLPLFFTNDKKAKLLGCEEAINQERKKAGQPPLGKDPDVYHAASRPFSKHKLLMQHRGDNPSLGLFVSEIERRGIQEIQPGN